MNKLEHQPQRRKRKKKTEKIISESTESLRHRLLQVLKERPRRVFTGISYHQAGKIGLF